MLVGKSLKEGSVFDGEGNEVPKCLIECIVARTSLKMAKPRS